MRDENGNVMLKKNGEPRIETVRHNIKLPSETESSGERTAKRTRETEDENRIEVQGIS